jgi:hypothetical protein
MSLFSDPNFLRRCDELKQILQPEKFEPGSKISRGYADLGYEEFLVLPSQKLLSLYSGKVSEIPEGHSHHFFWVPTAVEFVQAISNQADLLGMDFISQRSWRIRFRPQMATEESLIESSTLEDALLQTYAAVCKKA